MTDSIDVATWNDSETLVFTLTATSGPLSRADLVQRSGLSKATILWAVERLLARGVIELGGTEGRNRPGPRPRLYRASATAAFGVGVEIHRRGIDVDVRAVGDVPLHRKVSELERQPGLDDVAAAVDLACSEAGVRAEDAAVIAVSVGGGVDPRTGRLLSWNLPNWHQDLVTGLTEQLHAPVELENETNLWAMAEREFGTCQDQPDFVLMTLNADTGVGGALVFDGSVRHGRMGLSGEFGYLPLAASEGGSGVDPTSNADLRTLLESDAIMALARTAGRTETSAVEAIRAAGVRSGADGPDAVLEAFADRVAFAFRAVLAMVDPGCFVLAGDIGLAGGAMLAKRVRARLQPVFGSLGVDAPDVFVSTVTDEPIHRGLMSLVQHRVRRAVIGRSNAGPTDGAAVR